MRKFSESLDNEIDTEYIRHCFADLIDSGKAIMEKSSAAHAGWVEIHCNIEFPKKPELDLNIKFRDGASCVMNTSKIGDSAKKLEEAAEMMREIETSIKRLADEYPNYSFKIGSKMGGLLRVIIFP